MNLRTRLFLGYGYLVSLLVISAAGAALGFQQLGADIGRVLVENIESMRASTMMLEALERQDSAVLGVLLGKPTSKELLVNSEKSFLEGFEAARSNINLPGEDEVVGAISRHFEAYRGVRDALLAGPHEDPLRVYGEETFPRFEAVKDGVLTLLEINRQAIVEADRNAQQSANRRAVLHGLLVAIALLSLGFLSREMRRNILDRLDELKSVAEVIASGDRSRRASVRHKDELGLVAQQINAILDREREVEGRTTTRFTEQQQWIIALLKHMDRPAALVSSAGDVIASTLAPEVEGILRMEVPKRLPDIAKGLADSQNIEYGAHHFHLDRLGVDEYRSAGWLVSLADKG